MKTMVGATMASKELRISLHSMLRKEFSDLKTHSDDDQFDVNQNIHEVRKCIKAILAIIILYKTNTDEATYSQWKSYLKALKGQCASLRESYVNLQTFSKLEDELNELDKVHFDELGGILETKYKSLVTGNQRIKGILKQLHNSIDKIALAINQSSVNSDLEILQKRHKKTLQKTKQLFEVLTINSNANDFHRLRRWSRYLYLQQSIFEREGFLKVSSKKNKLLHELNDYLGEEHDLQSFFQYLKENFTSISKMAEPIFIEKIDKLREKILKQYPAIYS
jgi:hypothetical protein